MLPGTDALLLQKIFLGIFLGMTVIILALNTASAAMMGAQAGHLPWPIVQWAVTTPLGTLVLALGVGLLWGLPFVYAARVGSLFTYAVDVTELPPPAWPARPVPPWRRPGGPTRAEYWLGRGVRARVISLLALALAVLLALGFFAAYSAVAWYGITHFPDCTGSRCPPTYEYLKGSPQVIGLTVMFLSQYGWVRHVERRCGIWFRVPYSALGGFTCYVRRPGVTPEAAAAALARTSGAMNRPWARRAFVALLCGVPFFLGQIALGVLVTWLPTQWTPQ